MPPQPDPSPYGALVSAAAEVMSTADITIVGLGPGDEGSRTLAAQAALNHAEKIILRTAIHPGVQDLATWSNVIVCDDLYESEAHFDHVYQAIADRVLDAAALGPVVFAVPGHPRLGERSVAAIAATAEMHGRSVLVLTGVSALDAISVALRVDPLAEQIQIFDGGQIQAAEEREPIATGLNSIDPTRPVLVGQVYSPRVAAAVKLALAHVFGDEHEIVVVTAAGVADQERLDTIPVWKLDRVPVNHLTSVWVPAQSSLSATRSAATLQRIVAQLRAPDGCPWDRDQTHASLRNAVINEAYEVVDAIDAGHPDNLAEELGDLLLTAHMHAQIAEEAGSFSILDVFDHINRKLVRRHPHVFGDDVAHTPDQVLETWNAIKARERATKAPNGEIPKPRDPVARWPASMPALTVAQRILSKEPVERVTGVKGNRNHNDPALRILAAVAEIADAGDDPEQLVREALTALFNSNV